MRINARGYEQVDGEHYDEHSKAAPVVSRATIFILLILICMNRGYAHLLDVNGAFLLGGFERGEKIYMEVPQGFKKYYGSDVVWLLLKTIYGLKQSAQEEMLSQMEAKMLVKMPRPSKQSSQDQIKIRSIEQ